MPGKEPKEEATIREVLAELGFIDLGGVLKNGLLAMACFTVLLAAIVLISSAGYRFRDLGVPDWAIWLLLAWLVVHSATSRLSFHKWSWNRYFPCFNWLGSFVLAAYLLGVVYLLILATNLDGRIGRFLAFVLLWFVYTAPFAFFMSAIGAGYARVMEKRKGGT